MAIDIVESKLGLGVTVSIRFNTATMRVVKVKADNPSAEMDLRIRFFGAAEREWIIGRTGTLDEDISLASQPSFSYEAIEKKGVPVNVVAGFEWMIDRIP